jgi:NADH:ubiquinone oxidoreductase subunit 6 (subunit J)
MTLMSIDSMMFYTLALLTGVCAVAVVVAQNIVRAAAFLLFALAGTAGIFFLLNAQFVGATQLLVYVGGTLVLVVFGVMLTAQGPFITMRIGAMEWAIAGSVGLLLYAVLAVSLLQIDVRGAEQGRMSDSKDIGVGFIGGKESAPKSDVDKPIPEAALTGVPPTDPKTGQPIAPLMRARVSYLLPFEIVSVHLLVVLIGAAYLARAKRKRKAEG